MAIPTDLGPLELALLRGADYQDAFSVYKAAGATIFWLVKSGYASVELSFNGVLPIVTLRRTNKPIQSGHALVAYTMLEALGLVNFNDTCQMRKWLSAERRLQMAKIAQRNLIRLGYISVVNATFARRFLYCVLFATCISTTCLAFGWFSPSLGVYGGIILFALTGIALKKRMPYGLIYLKKAKLAVSKITSADQGSQNPTGFAVLLKRGYILHVLQTFNWSRYVNKPSWFMGDWPTDPDLAAKLAQKIVGLLCGEYWPREKAYLRQALIPQPENTDPAKDFAEAVGDFVECIDNVMDDASDSGGDCGDVGDHGGDCGDGGGDWN